MAESIATIKEMVQPFEPAAVGLCENCVIETRRVCERFSMFPNRDDIGEDRANFWMGIQQGNLFFKLGWFPGII
jgi:hypothetical protein